MARAPDLFISLPSNPNRVKVEGRLCLEATPAGDKHLLRVPGDVEEEDELRLERIREEVDRGFDALRDIEDGVSVFGSARIAGGPPLVRALPRDRRPASPSTASR